MMSFKPAVLLAVAAVIALASSAAVNPLYDLSGLNTINGDKFQLSIPDFTDNDDNDNKVNDPSQVVIDGIHLEYLTNEERKVLLDKDDLIVSTELDIVVAKKILEDRNNSENGLITGDVVNGGRQKRWVPVLIRLFTAGRTLFRGAARAPKPTVSGSRITQQYTRPGNFNDANRHFNAFRPDNVQSFSKNGISGRTGTVGNHRVTVRDGSKQGSPTLEIRSPKPNGEHVRKFRYENK